MQRMSRFLVVFCLYAISLPLYTACAQNGVAKILEANKEGVAVIIRNDEPLDAVSGVDILAGDRLMTCPACKIDVALNNSAGVRVIGSGNTQFLNIDAKDTRLKVEKGNVIINIPKLPAGSEFRVETPAAVTAVRGTQFWGRVKPLDGEQSVTTFAVRKGFVEISLKQTGETFTIHEGQAMDISMEEKMPSIRKALDEEMAAMQQADEIKTYL